MRVLHRSLGLALCLVLSALTGSGQEVLSVNKLVFALKPDKNPELMLREKAALEGFLAEQLGRPVEVVLPLSAATILEGLSNGTIDLGYLSSTDMVNARNRRLATILLAGQFEDGRTAYDSYWVVPVDSPHRDIADLRGRPVAFASRTSTSGFVIPVHDLAKRGLLGPRATLASFFGRGHVIFGSGYVSAIERVLAGEAEAAAVSYYVLDLDRHLSLEQRAALRRLQSQGPVPSHVIAARATLTEQDLIVLRRVLQAFNAPEHQQLRDKLFTTKLVEVDAEAHLAPLADALITAQRVMRP